MKTILLTLSTLCAAASLAACNGTVNTASMLGAGASLAKAATLSDADVKGLADQACAESDKENKFATARSAYAKRLQKVMSGLKADGAAVDARVYMTKDVNAWAMANGCVRVYSGLMDLMTDDEVRAVVGHEIGHVALGHSRKAMQVSYTTVAARGALAATGNSAVAALSQSQLGDLTQALVNAQFSQAQEMAADDFAFDLLTKNKGNTQSLVTAFEKLAKLDGGKSSLFSSHPGSDERARHIKLKIAQAGATQGN